MMNVQCAQVGRFTGKNTLSSMRLANAKKAKYMIKQVNPIFQSNLYRFSANATYNPINVDSSDIAE